MRAHRVPPLGAMDAANTNLDSFATPSAAQNHVQWTASVDVAAAVAGPNGITPPRAWGTKIGILWLSGDYHNIYVQTTY